MSQDSYEIWEYISIAVITIAVWLYLVYEFIKWANARIRIEIKTCQVCGDKQMHIYFNGKEIRTLTIKRGPRI